MGTSSSRKPFPTTETHQPLTSPWARQKCGASMCLPPSVHENHPMSQPFLQSGEISSLNAPIVHAMKPHQEVGLPFGLLFLQFSQAFIDLPRTWEDKGHPDRNELHSACHIWLLWMELLMLSFMVDYGWLMMLSNGSSRLIWSRSWSEITSKNSGRTNAHKLF